MLLEEPSVHGVDPTEGFGLPFEQVGGQNVPRGLFNFKLRQWDGFLNQVLVSGLPPWDARVNYVADAEARSFVLGSDGQIYVALVASGPATGDATDPVTPNNMTWRRY